VVDEPFHWVPQLAGSIAAGDNPVFSLNGNSAADGDATSDATGGIRVRSGGSADNETAVLLNTNNSNFAYDLAREPYMAASIRTDADDITEIQYLVGLASDDDGDAAFDGDNDELDPNNGTNAQTILAFSFDTDDGDSNWQVTVKDGSGNSVSESDTGVAVSVDTHYFLAVEVAADKRAYFYINGGLVHSTGALTSTDTLGPVCGVSQLAGSVRDIFIRRLALGQNFS